MSNNTPNKQGNPSRFWVRALALFLTALMLLGVIAFIIPYFGLGSSAASAVKPPKTADGSDYLVAVGLMYGTNVTVGFDVTTGLGFTVGSVNTAEGSSHEFTPLWEFDRTVITATCDANLSRTGNDYGFAASSSATVVGGYHAQIAAASQQEAQELVTAINGKISSSKGYAYPCYVHGAYAVRVGCSSTMDAVDGVITELSKLGYTAEKVMPSPTGVILADMTGNRILFHFDCGKNAAIGLQAKQNGKTEQFLTTPAKNTYRGIFRFARTVTGDVQGVELVNILPLEDYVQGVMPWEVPTAWDAESLRTFAIAIRTVAVRSLVSSKHKAYNFNVCATDDCQVYKGMNRSAASVVDAVTSTKGQIIASVNTRGDITVIETLYSSSTGGTTNSNTGAWGTAGVSYLSAICTPWERYEDVSNGSWTVSYTPAELYKRLKTRTSALTGNIAKVEITQYSYNSNYAYAVKVTDVNGKSATVTGGSNITSWFGLKSSNFVVGKGGSTVTRYDYVLADTEAQCFFTGVQPEDFHLGAYALDGDGELCEMVTDGDPLYALNAKREAEAMTGTLYAVGGDGKVAPVQTHTIAKYSSEHLPDVASLVTKTVKTETKVVLPGDKGSFVFVGRGWGHGVGMSAYGVNHLASFGYDHETILKTYFQGVQIRTADEYFAGK